MGKRYAKKELLAFFRRRFFGPLDKVLLLYAVKVGAATLAKLDKPA